jgi:peptidoglycan hydrolase CwlO-like protein
MEILVTINVAFILLTLVTSVFLFTTGFFNNIIKKTEKESEAYNYINYLDNKLNKAQSFSLNSLKEDLYFTFNNNDTLYVSSKKHSHFLFNEVKEIQVKIKTFNGEEQEYSTNNPVVKGELKSTKSQDISEMKIIFRFKSRDYELSFSNSQVSIKKVKNIL